MLRQYAEEISRLKTLLERQAKGEEIHGKDLPAHSLTGSQIRVEQKIVVEKDKEAEDKLDELQYQME